MSEELRLCGYCQSWHRSPCGDGCHWSPSDPTVWQFRREALAKSLFEKAMIGHAQWENMAELHKEDWRKKADSWISTDLNAKREHARRHPLPVTFESNK